MDRTKPEYKVAKRAYDKARYDALSKEERETLARRLASNHLKRKYGITIEEYERMIEEQGGCAICGRTEEEEGRRLAVDHSHSSGDVRSLLCYNCNRGLGHFQEDAALLRRAAEYMEEWECS